MFIRLVEYFILQVWRVVVTVSVNFLDVVGSVSFWGQFTEFKIPQASSDKNSGWKRGKWGAAAATVPMTEAVTVEKTSVLLKTIAK